MKEVSMIILSANELDKEYTNKAIAITTEYEKFRTEGLANFPTNPTQQNCDDAKVKIKAAVLDYIPRINTAYSEYLEKGGANFTITRTHKTLNKTFKAILIDVC